MASNAGGGADYDPKRDLFVFTFFSSHDSADVYVRDLTSPRTAPSRKVGNVSGGPSADIKFADSAARTFDAATWTKISHGTLAPENNVNGNWSRFRIAKFDLGGGLVEVAVMVGNVCEHADDGFVYAFRVPAP